MAPNAILVNNEISVHHNNGCRHRFGYSNQTKRDLICRIEVRIVDLYFRVLVNLVKSGGTFIFVDDAPITANLWLALKQINLLKVSDDVIS